MSPSFCPNFKLEELITIPLAEKKQTKCCTYTEYRGATDPQGLWRGTRGCRRDTTGICWHRRARGRCSACSLSGCHRWTSAIVDECFMCTVIIYLYIIEIHYWNYGFIIFGQQKECAELLDGGVYCASNQSGSRTHVQLIISSWIRNYFRWRLIWNSV